MVLRSPKGSHDAFNEPLGARVKPGCTPSWLFLLVSEKWFFSRARNQTGCRMTSLHPGLSLAPSFKYFLGTCSTSIACWTLKEHNIWGFPGGSSGKEDNAGEIRDAGSIARSGRSPGERHGNPLQDSGLENPMDRGAWWATVHRVTKSRTRLKQLGTHTRRFAEGHC